MARKRKLMPTKQTMNLYYKADRTTKPATVSLYILFIIVVLLGLSKILVYDLWVKVGDARVVRDRLESRLSEAMQGISDYKDVKKEYQRYSATDEERRQIDRMEIVRLIDEKVASFAKVRNYAITGERVQIQIDQVTLAQTAEIVRQLEQSPIVVRTTVNTASTVGADGERDLVSAGILIELVKEEEADETAVVSP